MALRANNFSRARCSSSSGVVPTMVDPIDSIKGVCFLCCCLGPSSLWSNSELELLGIFFLMSLLVVCFDAFRPLEIVQFKRLEGRCESIPFLCKKVKSFVHKAILVISFDAR